MFKWLKKFTSWFKSTGSLDHGKLTDNLHDGRECVKEVVDISRHPRHVTPLLEEDEVTIGDLHGNAMKLLHFLISKGVITLGDEGDYERLYNIYDQSINSTKSDLDIKSFKDILSRAKIKNTDGCIRLIGDDLADRGVSDLLTLYVMDKVFEESQLKFSVVVSNHGAAAIEIYEIMAECESFKEFDEKFKERKGYAIKIDDTGRGGDHNLGKSDTRFQNSSMHGLLVAAQQSHDEFLEAKNMYVKYKEHLKLIDYSINKDGKLIIYTHAPIDLSEIYKLAEHYNIKKPEPEDVKNICALIDNINQKFNELAKKGGKTFIKEMQNDVLFDFIWKRRTDKYTIHKDIIFVHGHDGPDNTLIKKKSGLFTWFKKNSRYFFNLDSSYLGRPGHASGDLDLVVTKGEYTSYEQYLSSSNQHSDAKEKTSYAHDSVKGAEQSAGSALSEGFSERDAIRAALNSLSLDKQGNAQEESSSGLRFSNPSPILGADENVTQSETKKTKNLAESKWSGPF